MEAFAVAADAFLISRRGKILALAEASRLPAIFPNREFAEDGGLASFGTSWAATYRAAGVYAGRILKGERPADLPVQRPVAFELVLNQQTARAIGFDVPPTFVERADEVIE
jgi:putative tryptophan/tyrosine transport system substrate-binding protein